MRTDTVVIGAGQAGLALSRHLVAVGHDHVVVERDEIGARWRRQTWDSLRLLTPNWMNVLPGAPPTGGDPDGFATARQFAHHLAGYARATGAPVVTGTEVDAVRRRGDRFEVSTSGGTWSAGNVVVATGWCDRPAVPALAGGLRAEQLTADRYRRPDDLAPGGVLVVGASATGVQLAHELRLAGRDVVLAVGDHTRLPRTYRGMDVFWWLQRIGALERTVDSMPDAHAARREPSLQLVGRDDHRPSDLRALHDAGVRLAGRLVGAEGWSVRFDDGLGRRIADAEQRMAAQLARIDAHIAASGLEAEVLPADAPAPPPSPADVGELDLRAAGITTVLWATGHRREYPWLHVPVLDGHGEIRQDRGMTPVPGLYVLGQRFQHRRWSNFIGGVGADAAFVAAAIGGISRCPEQESSHVPG